MEKKKQYSDVRNLKLKIDGGKVYIRQIPKEILYSNINSRILRKHY